MRLLRRNIRNRSMTCTLPLKLNQRKNLRLYIKANVKKRHVKFWYFARVNDVAAKTLTGVVCKRPLPTYQYLLRDGGKCISALEHCLIPDLRPVYLLQNATSIYKKCDFVKNNICLWLLVYIVSTY